MIQKAKPRYELSKYREFIRDAAPYVSLIVGRRISAVEADLMTDDQIREIAVKIDERVKDLKAN
jgi:hypothetical protein